MYYNIVNFIVIILLFLDNNSNVYLGNNLLEKKENLFTQIEIIKKNMTINTFTVPKNSIKTLLYIYSDVDITITNYENYKKIILLENNYDIKQIFTKPFYKIF
jgi:hypothetical protein